MKSVIFYFLLSLNLMLLNADDTTNTTVNRQDIGKLFHFQVSFYCLMFNLNDFLSECCLSVWSSKCK